MAGESGVVAGNRLRTVEDGRGGMLIRSREAYAMGAAGTVAIRDYPHPIWEPEDAPAGEPAEGRKGDRPSGEARPAGAPGGEAADAAREAIQP